MLGNLARATFVGSSDFMWPYSYNQCDPDKRMSQEINACAKINHYGLASKRGRGAPEIDLIEAMQGDSAETLPSTTIKRPYQSASLQVRSLDLFIASIPLFFISNLIGAFAMAGCPWN